MTLNLDVGARNVDACGRSCVLAHALRLFARGFSQKAGVTRSRTLKRLGIGKVGFGIPTSCLGYEIRSWCNHQALSELCTFKPLIQLDRSGVSFVRLQLDHLLDHVINYLRWRDWRDRQDWTIGRQWSTQLSKTDGIVRFLFALQTTLTIYLPVSGLVDT